MQAKNPSGFGLGAGIKRFYMYKYIQHYSKTKKYLEYSNKCTTCIFQGTKHRKQDVYELPLPGDSTRQVLFLQGQGHLSSVYQKSQTCFTRNKKFFRNNLGHLHFISSLSDKTIQIILFEIFRIQKIQLYFLF